MSLLSIQRLDRIAAGSKIISPAQRFSLKNPELASGVFSCGRLRFYAIIKAIGCLKLYGQKVIILARPESDAGSGFGRALWRDGLETRVLIQSVKRNKERFPDDFMFQYI